MKGTSKGKSFNDRTLAAEVRTLGLERVRELFKKGKGRLYEQVLTRMSGSLIPRLNELTGENGGPLIVELPGVIIKKNGINSATGKDSERSA